MERIDKDFLDELKTRIDETLQEKSQGGKEAVGSQFDGSSENNVIAEANLILDHQGNLGAENGDETVMFDLTEEEIIEKRNGRDISEIDQKESSTVSFRRYHPMEISTNAIVTKDNVEFCVRKFVKDLKECLEFSKVVSIHFEIKTVEEDPEMRQV